MTVLNENQRLTETWTATYERVRGIVHRRGAPSHSCRMDVIINGTAVATSGNGHDTDGALLSVLLSIAVNQVLCAAEALDEGEREIAMVTNDELARAIKILRRAQRLRAKTETVKS